MKLIAPFMLSSFVFMTVQAASAASFDCAKARAPIEKLICKAPELNAADGAMGEAFSRANKSFPIKGFVLQTQKMFLSGLPFCMKSLEGKPLTESAAVPACLAALRQRTEELERYERARVYGNSKGKFDPESTTLLIVEKEGKTFLYSWGNWMPDSFDPKPFPDGSLCEFEAELMPVPGGFKVSEDDEAVISISDAKVHFSSYVMCTARNGGFEGDYPRMR